MTTSNTPPSELVSRVVETLAADEVTCPQCAHTFALPQAAANRVIVAYNAVRDGGDPVGTTRKGPNGEFALRVDDPAKGPLWRVTPLDGSAPYDDMNPTLAWDQANI